MYGGTSLVTLEPQEPRRTNVAQAAVLNLVYMYTILQVHFELGRVAPVLPERTGPEHDQ